jgi:hypothetical protein
MMTHWKAILGVVLIFAFGFASGMICTSIIAQRKLTAFLKHPGAVAEAALEKRLERNLKLDPDQKTKIHALFLDNLQQRRELSAQIRPQTQMLNLQTFQQIQAVLRPDQQALFRLNIEEFKNRFGKAAANTEVENMFPPGSTLGGSPGTQQ